MRGSHEKCRSKKLALKLRKVYKLVFFVKPGDLIEEITNHTKRAGCVITKGETRYEAVSRACEAIDNIKIEIQAV